MSKTRSQVLDESKRKGLTAGIATTAAITAAALAPPLGALVAVPAVFFGWRWWKHRAENGIRF